MTSISLSVSESNESKDSLKMFVEEVNDLYGKLDSDAYLSLEDVEVRVSDAFISLRRKFLDQRSCLIKG